MAAAVGNDLFGLTGDRKYQQRAGLRELLGDEVWPLVLAAGGGPGTAKAPIVKSWAALLAAARGETVDALATSASAEEE
jgi:hypothetical protein